MSQAVAAARLVYRSSLLRNVRERHQLNTIFKRSASDTGKKVSKPAPYLTREVVWNKVMELTPGWIMAGMVFIGCKFYLDWNGIDYHEIVNYKANYVSMRKEEQAALP